MSSWRQQALIEAPLEAVWELVGNPRRYPEWAGWVVEVTGLPTVERDATFQQVSRSPVGKQETTFRIEHFEDLREIRLRCQKSGYYSHWWLTEARDATFTDVELGIEPIARQYQLFYAAVGGKRYFRRIADRTIDGLREAVGDERMNPAGQPGDHARRLER